MGTTRNGSVADVLEIRSGGRKPQIVIDGDASFFQGEKNMVSYAHIVRTIGYTHAGYIIYNLSSFYFVAEFRSAK